MLIELVVLAGVLAAIGFGAVERHRRAQRREHSERIVALLLTTMAPAVARAEPRELLAWRSAANGIRELFPEQVETIEARTGNRFPFPRALIEDAHARWTADWLAWERQHDIECRERVAALTAELNAVEKGGAPAVRAKLDALEDEKLQDYQRRYEEYVRVGNGLVALMKTDTTD